MKTRASIWWLLLVSMCLVVSIAWIYQAEFSANQSKLISELGEDISTNQKKWENARLHDVGPFSWWIDLDLGHGLTKQTSSIVQLALVGISILLASAVFVLKKENIKLAQQGGAVNPHACGTFVTHPADAGSAPKASGDT